MTKVDETKKALIPLSPTENLAVGCVGGALETCLQMPILTYKLCLQEKRKLPSTFAGFYRGVGVQASTVAPITAIQFMVNGMLGSTLLKGENRKLSDKETICTAAGAGIISSFLYSPVDLTTIQQQKLNKNPFQTITYLMKEYGTLSIFRGISSCAVREAIYTAGYLGLAPVITSHLTNTDYFKENRFLASVSGACAAGIIAATLTHPVDTAKTIMQADMSGTTWKNARSTTIILFNEQGISSLYRGFIPRTIRICGAFFVCMSLNEMATRWKNN